MEMRSGIPWLHIPLVNQPGAGARPSERKIPLSELTQADRLAAYDALRQAFGQWAPIQAQQATDHLAHAKVAETAFAARLGVNAPRAWAVLLLTLLSVAGFLFQLLVSPAATALSDGTLLQWGGNATSAVQAGQGWRLLTALLLHSGWVHLALDVALLWTAGMPLTRWFGNRSVLIVYVVSGLVGNALSLRFSAQMTVLVGASGATFGVAGVLLVALWQYRQTLLSGPRLLLMAAVAFLMLVSLNVGRVLPHVDLSAQLGGLLAGILMAFLLVEQFNEHVTPAHRMTRQWLAAALGILLAVALTWTTAPARRDLVHFEENLRVVTALESDYLSAERAFQLESGKLQSLADRRRSQQNGDSSISEQDLSVFAQRFDAIGIRLRQDTAQLASLHWAPADPVGKYVQAQRRILTALAEWCDLNAQILRGQVPSNVTERVQTLQQTVNQAVGEAQVWGAMFLKEVAIASPRNAAVPGPTPITHQPFRQR